VQEPSDLATPGVPAPLREDQIGGARNAVRQTGPQAFDRAQASSKLADSKTLASADEVASSRLEALAKDESRASATRLVAGRLFIRRNQVWTDVAHTDRITVTAVAAYSKAYFDLVRQLPEVAPYLSVGAEVLIAGRRASVRVGGSGIEIWQPGQLAEVVRNFRGT
jgi:hypothetical protein